MLATEKLEAENLIQKLPDESTFEDIQYHLYVAEKLKNARQQIKERKVYSQSEVEKRLDKWIMK
jgi:acetyl-CoA carboxylase beta subunit